MELQSVLESWSVSSAASRGQRDQLIRFWLSCPDDVLESLWAGSPGSTSREMIAVKSHVFMENKLHYEIALESFLEMAFSSRVLPRF